MKNGIIIEVSRDELRSIIAEEMHSFVENVRSCSTEIARNALVSSGLVSNMITKRDAYRLFGRQTVDRWLRDGNLKAYADKERGWARIDRTELHQCARKFNTQMRGEI